MQRDLFASDEPIDLDRLHEFLVSVVNRKQNEPRKQPLIDLEERTALNESRTSACCDLIKTVQVFNKITSSNPTNAQQYQENLATQLEPIYTKIADIDIQFSKDKANREHYNLPPFVKPQTQLSDKELYKENITTLIKMFDTETETIKHQMQSTMRATGQDESSTDDDRSSTCSYKGKGLKGGKQMTYCSACGKPDHSATKCRIKHTLFCYFCNKWVHSAKACRHRMNGHNICVHCRLDHENKPCQQSCQNNREDLRNSPSMPTGLPRPYRYNLTPRGMQLIIPRPYGFDIYPQPGNGKPNGPTGFNRPTEPNEYWNFGPNGSSTPFRSPNLEELKQTLLALTTQSKTAINQLVKTQMSQNEAFTTVAEAEEKRGYDLDFASIPIFNGKDKMKFQEWFRHTQYTCA